MSGSPGWNILPFPTCESLIILDEVHDSRGFAKGSFVHTFISKWLEITVFYCILEGLQVEHTVAPVIRMAGSCFRDL